MRKVGGEVVDTTSTKQISPLPGPPSIAPHTDTQRERERHSELSLRQCWLDLALHQLKELTPLVPNQHKYPPTQRHIQLNTPLWLKISNPGPPLYPSIRTNTCPYFHPPPLYFVVLLSLSQNVPPLSCSPSPKAPLFSFILHTHMHIIHIYIWTQHTNTANYTHRKTNKLLEGLWTIFYQQKPWNSSTNQPPRTRKSSPKNPPPHPKLTNQPPTYVEEILTTLSKLTTTTTFFTLQYR